MKTRFRTIKAVRNCERPEIPLSAGPYRALPAFRHPAPGYEIHKTGNGKSPVTLPNAGNRKEAPARTKADRLAVHICTTNLSFFGDPTGSSPHQLPKTGCLPAALLPPVETGREVEPPLQHAACAMQKVHDTHCRKRFRKTACPATAATGQDFLSLALSVQQNRKFQENPQSTRYNRSPAKAKLTFRDGGRFLFPPACLAACKSEPDFCPLLGGNGNLRTGNRL